MHVNFPLFAWHVYHVEGSLSVYDFEDFGVICGSSTDTIADKNVFLPTHEPSQ